MSFLHPEFLYFMLPPLFILFGFLLTQKESQAHFFSQEVMRKLRVSANSLTLRARNALFLLVGTLMIVALAQPVINEGVIQVKAKSADIMIAMDISDSMLGEDVYPNRLKLAKQKAMELLKEAPNERIGVIAFAKNSYLVSPLSFDHDAVGFLLRQLNTDSITEKGTDFLSMLDAVNSSLSKQSKKYLLILSDGGDKDDFSQEIASAKEKNIAVFVLGIGTSKGAPIKLEEGNFVKYKGNIIISKLNENISELATKSGGVYIQNLTSNDDIKAMLREIEKVSEQKELKSEDVHRYIPLFYYPIGLALFILLLATSSMSKRKAVHLPSVFLLFAIFFANPHAKADVLDFMKLKDAKEAYEAKEYEKAAKLYQEYGDSSKNGQSYYDAGNAYYKQQKYKEAIESYEKATFEDKESRANNFANMANAYAKQGSTENLKKAVQKYEDALKIKEDKQTRENLEAVKKAIQKEEQNSQEKKDSQENKDSKDKEKSDKNEKDSQENQKNNENNTSKENQKNSENNDSNSSQDKQKEEQKEDEEKQKQDAKEQKSKEDMNQTNEQKEQKQELQELDKNENNQTKEASPHNIPKKEMSDAEEQKWIQQLNLEKNTYMYRLNNQKIQKDDSNEKPW